MRNLMFFIKYTCVSALVSGAVFSGAVNAELTPINDRQMSDITGQAAVSIDEHVNPNAGQNTVYTRVNFGLDIETQMNADSVVLGEYARAGETNKADIDIADLSLGHIYDSNYYANNPSMPKPIKSDGSGYRNGEIVPFKITDPFVEFARDSNTNDITGMRIGFGGAEGLLSGKIKTLTGRVNVKISDRGAALKEASSQGSIIDKALILLAPLLVSGSPITADAELVAGTKDSNGKFTTGSGQLDGVRSNYIGMADGSKFTIHGANGLTTSAMKLAAPLLSSTVTVNASCFLVFCGGGSIDILPENCDMLGVTTCFPLTNFNSLPVGKIQKDSNGNRTLKGEVPGMFLSFGTKDMQWLTDVKKKNPTASDFMNVTKGAFFNIPNGVLEVDLKQALNSIPRVRTEYIDRGRGLF